MTKAEILRELENHTGTILSFPERGPWGAAIVVHALDGSRLSSSINFMFLTWQKYLLDPGQPTMSART